VGTDHFLKDNLRDPIAFPKKKITVRLAQNWDLRPISAVLKNDGRRTRMLEYVKPFFENLRSQLGVRLQGFKCPRSFCEGKEYLSLLESYPSLGPSRRTCTVFTIIAESRQSPGVFRELILIEFPFSGWKSFWQLLKAVIPPLLPDGLARDG